MKTVEQVANEIGLRDGFTAGADAGALLAIAERLVALGAPATAKSVMAQHDRCLLDTESETAGSSGYSKHYAAGCLAGYLTAYTTFNRDLSIAQLFTIYNVVAANLIRNLDRDAA